MVTFLREHALLGRLSDEELEDRIGLAYASITVGDLERLIADLPRGGRTAAPRRPAPRPPHRAVAHRRGPSPALIGVCAGALLLTGLPIAALVGVVAIAVTLVALVFALSVVFGPLLLIALLIIATARRRRPQRQHMRWGPTTY